MASTVSNINMTMNTTRCVVDGKRAQEEFSRLTDFIGRNVYWEYYNDGQVRLGDSWRMDKYNSILVFFYTKQIMTGTVTTIKGTRKYISNSGDIINEDYRTIDQTLGMMLGGRSQGVYRLIRFYTTTGILILRENEAENMTLIEKEYRCNFGQSCILGIEDFTEEFKTSQLPIEKQLEIMVEMNNKKHMEARDFKLRLSRMESMFSMMQNQIDEQAKLIVSLQTKKIEEQVNLEAEVDLLLSDDVIGEQLSCEAEEKDKAEVEDIVADEIEEDKLEDEAEADEADEKVEADEEADEKVEADEEVEEADEKVEADEEVEKVEADEEVEEADEKVEADEEYGPQTYRVCGHSLPYINGIYNILETLNGSLLYQKNYGTYKFYLYICERKGWCITDNDNDIYYWKSGTHDKLPEDKENITFEANAVGEYERYNCFSGGYYGIHMYKKLKNMESNLKTMESNLNNLTEWLNNLTEWSNKITEHNNTTRRRR